MVHGTAILALAALGLRVSAYHPISSRYANIDFPPVPCYEYYVTEDMYIDTHRTYFPA